MKPETINTIFVGAVMLIIGVIIGIAAFNEECPVAPDCICKAPACPDVQLTCPDPTIEVTERTNVYTTEIYNSHFEKIIQNAASTRPYLIDVWDCTEMTKTGIEDLKNAGYDCRFIEDYLIEEDGSKTYHAFGECDNLLIEFTFDDGTGKIVEPSNYHKYGDYCKRNQCLELEE